MSAYSGTLFKEIYLFPVLISPKCLRSTVYGLRGDSTPLLGVDLSSTCSVASASKRGGTPRLPRLPDKNANCGVRQHGSSWARLPLRGLRHTAFLWSTVYGLRSTWGFNPSPWRGAFLNLFRGIGFSAWRNPEIAPAPGQERKLRCPAARVLLGTATASWPPSHGFPLVNSLRSTWVR